MEHRSSGETPRTMAQRTSHTPAARTPRASRDGELLCELFAAHGQRVYGLCRLLLGDSVEAEDAAQETFLSAHRSLRKGLVPRDPSGWLSAIARNECRARIRARRLEPELLPWNGDSPQVDVEEVASRRADVAALREGLARLSEEQRAAIVLREFRGLSYTEVSAASGVPPTALKSVLFRARGRLRESLEAARLAGAALAGPLGLKLASVPVAANVAGATATVVVVGAIGGATPVGPPERHEVGRRSVQSHVAAAPVAPAPSGSPLLRAPVITSTASALSGSAHAAKPRSSRHGVAGSDEREREADEPEDSHEVEAGEESAESREPEEVGEVGSREEPEEAEEEAEPAASEENESAEHD